MTLTVGSLFSGIGGLELGLERAGMSTVWQVEKDEYCRRVLAKHWPDVQRFNDVREVGAHNLPPVDLICGGFPCQDISYAGSGRGLAGERSGLWYEFARIVREMGPRFVVVENVAALLTVGLDAVLGELAESGYDAEWSCIQALDVGAPHIRDRLFVIAYSPSDLRRTSRYDGPAPPDRRSSHLDDPHGCRLRKPGVVCQQSRRAKAIRTGEGKPGHQWITEPNVGRVANGVPARMERLKGLGNAVVPQVAEVVGRRVVAIAAALSTEAA